MNTEERAAHLASIRANPDDDLPRLVYADRLDENATAENGYAERAELIRVQCDLQQNPPNPKTQFGYCPTYRQWRGDMPSTDPVAKRDRELTLALIYTPFREIIPEGAIPSAYIGMDRGFISRAELSFDLWLKHADAILSESVGLTVKLTTHPIRTHLTATHLMFVGDEKRIALPWVIPHEGYESAYDDILVGHLRHRWPDVKAWELPERPDDMRRRMRDARREQGLPVQDEPFRVPPTVAPY